jgi:endoglycosylceramidase
MKQQNLVAGLLMGAALLGALVRTASSQQPDNSPAQVQPPATRLDPQACWAHLERGRLCAEYGQFWNENGQVVILRGVNVAGTSKVPPFLPLPKSPNVTYPPPRRHAAHFFTDNTDVRQLDYLQTSGFNVIRLLFNWEAYEPAPDHPNDSYLQMLTLIASESWKRGIYTVVDFHQDAFARWVDYGCGEGFPQWALGDGFLKLAPRNDFWCANWMTMAFTDLNGVQRAFNDFYAGRAPNQLRARFVSLMGTLAQRFHKQPGVIGYDILNEPFSYNFDNDLKDLYRDAGEAIRSSDPGAILFLEPDLLTDTNGQARLPKPFDTRTNVVYAPHFYDPTIMGPKKYSGPAASQQAFVAMRAFAKAWQAPFFLGEFGAPATAEGAADYITLLYDLLDGGQTDASPASGAQWVYSPGWTADKYDGWDTENFSIVDNHGPRTQLFVPRPYAREVSGIPNKLVVTGNSIHLEWMNEPQKTNQTVFFVPSAQTITPANIDTSGVPSGQLDCRAAGPQQVVCSSDEWETPLQVTITFTPARGNGS